MDPVPQITTMPVPSPAPAVSATSASLTTSVGDLYPMRRMMPRMIAASSGRSAPATPRQMAAGTIGRPASAPSITSCSTFSTSSSPWAWRFAPGPRPDDRTRPLASARRHTVFVPPASMPST
jgi:hypothetical protein